MDGRDLVRTVTWAASAGAVRRIRTVGAAWRGRRADAPTGPGAGAERARVPGAAQGAEPGKGGGVVVFARSRLRIMVAVNGAAFWGWDDAGPEPSYALGGACPEPDPRAVLEPDKDGGWRVVAERATIAVTRFGAVEVRTPGGVMLRRALPPRWWEPAGEGPARWLQRSEVAADARFFGLGARSAGPRLREGTYRLRNTAPGRPPHPGTDPQGLTMPVQFVVADAAAHLVFHDNTWDGTVTLREGAEGAGSGHDLAGTCELRMDGGPLRCWVMVGSPARVLRTWASLTGPAALPPEWALGHQHALPKPAGEREVRELVRGHRERELPLDAVHLEAARLEAIGLDDVHPDTDGSGSGRAGVPAPAGEPLREDARLVGVRLVTMTDPVVAAVHGCAGYDGETAPLPSPRTAQEAPDGPDTPDGDLRETHNLHGLCQARAAYEALERAAPGERPFVLSRSGWVGLQQYGGAWAGDVATGWPGLRATLSVVVGLGLCGVPYAGGDVGGAAGCPSAEMYLRWLQLGAYLPLFRTRGAGRDRPGGPWEFGTDVTGQARTALVERRRLTPYFMTLAHLARRTGAPMVRPVWWAAPEDRGLRDCQDTFLLGDCLLVAPVLEPGTIRRTVRLPRGRWYDTATEELYEGPGRVTVEAPLSRIPVLARAGSVVPVQGEDGGIALDVWEAAPGRGGGGLVAVDSGDTGQEVRIERYVTRRQNGRTVVQRQPEDGTSGPPRAVRIRGASRP